jgi:hypothetical protein
MKREYLPCASEGGEVKDLELGDRDMKNLSALYDVAG